MGIANMTTNMIVQYIIVALIIIGAIVWIVWKVIATRKHKENICCGCPVSDSCGKKRKRDGDKLPNDVSHESTCQNDYCNQNRIKNHKKTQQTL